MEHDRKQELASRLDALKVSAGEQPMSEKWYKRAKTWSIEAMIEFYEKEAGA